MCDQNDSIQKFYSDLPTYSDADFYNGIPYERALSLSIDRESMEACLYEINKIGEELALPKNLLDCYYVEYINEFLLSIGDPSVEIPEDVLEYAQQKAKIKELMLELEKRDSEEKSKELSLNADTIDVSAENNVPDNVIYFSDYKKSKGQAQKLSQYMKCKGQTQKPSKYSFGGKEFIYDFGRYEVDSITGRISYNVRIASEEETEEELKTEVFSHFVVPLAYVKSSELETVNVAFYRDNKWNYLWQIKKSDLYEPKRVTSMLLDAGIDVNMKKPELVAEYFVCMEKNNRGARIPIINTIECLGWGKKYATFAPYTQSVIYNGSKILARLYDGILAQRGSLNDWIETIKMFRDEQHSIARIILAASFASVLIRPLDGMRFIVDVVGKSGLGKSVSLRAAASVWGNPDIMIASFDSTENGALLRSNFLSDLPMILDESETQKNRTDYDEFIYTICGDYDRVKAVNNSVPLTSRNCIFISGEHPLSKKESNPGAKSRIIELFCDSYIYFDEKGNNMFVPSLNHNYGYAGRVFINRLIENGGLDHANEVYQRHFESFQNKRQGRIFAAILTADELMDEWIFHDNLRLSPEILMQYVYDPKEEERPIDYSQIHEIIHQWIQEQKSEHGYMETEKGRVLAKRGSRPEAYSFSAGVLERILGEEGCDTKEYLSWAKDNKKIYTGRDAIHKYQYQATLGGKKKWCYTVLLQE